MKTVVFAVGRFNPPTKGHQLMFDRVKNEAMKRKADMFIFVTATQDAERNPLNVKEKLYFLKQFFPGMPFSEALNPYEAAQTLAAHGYEAGVMVAGSDRADVFYDMIQTAMINDDPDVRINFKQFDVVKLERDADDDTAIETAAGATATKARKTAELGNYKSFRRITPKAPDQLTQMLYKAVRKGMGVE